MLPVVELPDPQWFRRSDQRFFHSQESKDAIINIARADALVIYCGSGVTMNRTGLSWYKLVTKLLHQEAAEESRAQNRPEDARAARRQLRVLRAALAPQHMASILSQTRLADAASEQTELSQLVRKLHELLYRDNGWQSGVIVRNIIRLAFGFLRLSRRVVLVTTNYDDYLEQEFDDYRRQVMKHTRQRGVPQSVPGLKVSVLDERHVSVVRNTKGTGQLEILYLHGRIPQHRPHNGRIVLSEWDYHLTNATATAELRSLFEVPDAAVLVLGSSLTDPPLLTALAATKGRNSERTRHALLPAQDAGIIQAFNAEDFERLTDYVGRRGQHFGVRLLVPDFRYQIAQFCEEVLASVSLAPRLESYLDEGAQMRYGLRLVAWWHRWCRTEYNLHPEAIHDVLTRTLEGVRDHLAGYRGGKQANDQPERMKLELWIRDYPKTKRRLALWGSSIGTLVDRSTVRTEDLRWGSGNASVRAFIEGRPQYVTRKVLAHERQPNQLVRNTRWEAFVSVPILIDYGRDDQPVGLPVGVVTLASMRPPHESGIRRRSSPLMDGLVSLLRSAGEALLRA